jgi:Ca2+-transporting ATPase
LPLLPLQILFLNFVTDVFPALALGVGEGSPRLMQQPPRAATERLLMPRHWRRIALHGVVIALVVLAAMAIALYLLEYDYKHSVSVAFLTLALAQMWHVFNMRGERRRPFDNEITRNPWIWVALCICLVCVFAAIYVPFLSNILALAAPGWRGWAVILLMSLLPLIAAPLIWPLTEGDAASIALE